MNMLSYLEGGKISILKQCQWNGSVKFHSCSRETRLHTLWAMCHTSNNSLRGCCFLFLVFLAHCVWLRFDKILNSVRRCEWQYLLFICLLELDSYTAEHTVQRAQSRATGAYYRDSLWWKARLQHFKAPTWGCRLCSLRQWCASVALCLRIKALQREPDTAQRYFFICWLWM